MKFRKLFIAVIAVFALFSFESFAQAPTPDLRCVQNNGTDVDLVWNPGNITCGATFQSFDIYSAFVETGPFTLVDQITDVNQTTYTDSGVISAASPFLFYYVQTNCGGLSTPSDVVSSDDPLPPSITFVTVGVDNTTTELFWEASTSLDAHGYIIYKENINGSPVPIDTIFEAGSLSYTDTEALAGEQAEGYTIATFDSCGLSPGPVGTLHKTVFAVADNDDCNSTITFDWTTYVGWGTDILEFRVIEEVSGTLELRGTTNASTNTFSYVLPDGQSNGCFRIHAVNGDGLLVTVSNLICVSINASNGPDFITLKQVTVNSDQEIQLAWNQDIDNTIHQLEVLIGLSDSNNLAVQTVIPPVTPYPADMTFVVDDVRADRNSYYFRIQDTDECNRSVESTLGRSIHLEGRDQLNLSNGLEWNPFELTGANIQEYVLYRSDGDNSNYQAISTFPSSPDQFFYEDAVSVGSSDITLYCYRIEANYTIPCEDGSVASLSSLSNEVCIAQSPRIYVPNAFAPNGVNSIFIPHILYPNEDAYSMLVMNKWGEVVFRTSNPSQGWNGEFKGEVAPQGVYAYVIQMTSLSGFALERKGSVFLMR